MKKNIIITSSLIALTALAVLPVFAKELEPLNAGKHKGIIIEGKKQITEKRDQRKAELKKSKDVDLACVQTAVEKRENAIISAFDTQSSVVKTALSARKDALKAAWAITDQKERHVAIKKAWSDFTVTAKKAKTQLRKDRDSAWETFRQDIKACKATNAVSEESAKGIENTL